MRSKCSWGTLVMSEVRNDKVQILKIGVLFIYQDAFVSKALGKHLWEKLWILKSAAFLVNKFHQHFISGAPDWNVSISLGMLSDATPASLLQNARIKGNNCIYMTEALGLGYATNSENCMSKRSNCRSIKTPFLFLLKSCTGPCILGCYSIAWCQYWIVVLFWHYIVVFGQSVTGMMLFAGALADFFYKSFHCYIWVLECLHHKQHCKKHRDYMKSDKWEGIPGSRISVKMVCTKFFLLSWALCPLVSIFLHVFFLSSHLLLPSSHAHVHICSDP